MQPHESTKAFGSLDFFKFDMHVRIGRSMSKMKKKLDLKFLILITWSQSLATWSVFHWRRKISRDYF